MFLSICFLLPKTQTQKETFFPIPPKKKFNTESTTTTSTEESQLPTTRHATPEDRYTKVGETTRKTPWGGSNQEAVKILLGKSGTSRVMTSRGFFLGPFIRLFVGLAVFWIFFNHEVPWLHGRYQWGERYRKKRHPGCLRCKDLLVDIKACAKRYHKGTEVVLVKCQKATLVR